MELKIKTETETVVISTCRPPTLEDRRALQQEPDGSPVMYQTWRNLLFLHWEWDPAEIQKLLPPGLFVDIFGLKHTSL